MTESAKSAHLFPTRSPRGSIWGGIAGLACVATWVWFASPWQGMLLNVYVIGIFVLGIAPMLVWLHRNDASYPLVGLLGLTLVPFYAVPFITEHKAIVNYPEEVLAQAASLVVLFQASSLLGSALSRRTFIKPRDTSFWFLEFIGDDSLKFTSYTMVSASLWTIVFTFTNLVPNEYIGSLRAIFFGVGMLSNFIRARMWGAGQLTRAQKGVFLANVILQTFLQSLSLVLVTAIGTTLLTIVGYFSSSKRIPWLVCILSIVIFGVLHNGKQRMRQIYWSYGAPQLEISSVPAYMNEWIGYSLSDDPSAKTAQPERQSLANIFQRASLIQIVAHAVDTVPSARPYLEGATYALIPPQVVPRFVWANKPSPNDSVKMLSVHLRLLTEEQAEKTSIAYGLIAESYVNFGTYGTGIVGFLLGWLLGRVALQTADCTTLSVGGVFRILCLAWVLNTETTMAVWTSSFYQASVAVFVPLFFLRSFFR